ncbi:SMP-30/gluconolactonase/LRE family protein [Niveispirillum cyanobacteriorum]|uniref:Gluconolactonase n=1 Tax=Niveispirillum cyanobacteriorum TaxID=1612173 RepID=A0A2K9N949_9PROT|nr:SMP-30/gluconolactonase/LRE family protein [Niveispirillum cyanobacteriorum]AUN29076.1 gluconolactonase [Niveispirillum cyanobacteriorum]GGE67806.1 calcium-binding protein [Niveispirillum cyanobacteriorum]
MSAFTPALPLRTRLGECPVWDGGAGILSFVDIQGRQLHRYHPADGALSSLELPEHPGCVVPLAGGGYVAGMRTGIYRLDADGTVGPMLAPNPTDPADTRFNDGRVDPAGHLIIGTIDEPKSGSRGGLYRLERGGLRLLLGGLLTSNGLAFSPDGRTLYHSDTPRFAIHAYDYDPASGQVANRRLFAQLDPDAPDRGRPDGAAVDAEGCYWTALYAGGRVQRYDPDGRLMAEYRTPARCPTMPCFGGPDAKTLYVTSVAAGFEGPMDGALFAMPVDVPGLPNAPCNPESLP